ncbi:response regulator transcription factor [Nocardioides sp.]|uniref:response regulator transcription factor n=1 Tax=Nocardioides sp. TaxID=35761 RepID=UPI0027347C07|nr:LuxR C-terminal-related transcriptional regulator [Nocardioides sp.]MDP3889820.1 LuxR C-terminal-related transcriptional regulator [Nocardioides sp.]
MNPEPWRPDDADREVLRLIADGLPVVAVGRRLGLSERTVRRRVQTMSRRVGVASTMELIVHAVRVGWI